MRGAEERVRKMAEGREEAKEEGRGTLVVVRLVVTHLAAPPICHPPRWPARLLRLAPPPPSPSILHGVSFPCLFSSSNSIMPLVAAAVFVILV